MTMTATTQRPRSVFRSFVTPLVTSGPNALERARCRGARSLEFYYECGDPHSHLCAQLLPELQRRVALPIEIHVVPIADEALYPDPERQRAFAMQDAALIAPAWGLQLPGRDIPAEEDRFRVARCLLAAQGVDDFVRREADCTRALFNGGDTAAAARNHASLDPAASERELAANADRRLRRGHYLPAMWQFNGEWFWALDRLGLLEARLRAQGLVRGDAPLAAVDPAAAQSTEVAASLPLEFWFSFRSPYSYLAAEQLRTNQRLHPRLQIRPVLPMAMRGFKVPRAKRFYIVRDVQRLADAAGIPFGRIADPLGSGAQRLLAVFPLADGVEQQLAYLCAAGRAVWAEGVDVSQDAGLRYVVETAGMDWQRAAAMLQEPIDIRYAEVNREALFEAGLWGVPSFRCGEFVTWGQDRLAYVGQVLGNEQ